MPRRNHWSHYKIHRQPVGTSNGRGGIAWAYPWQVTRPSNHELMQGDDWELHAYKMFDTFEHALDYAFREATKDRLRIAIDEFVDENIGTLVNVAPRLYGLIA
jgi:hypothetical protein